MSKIWNVSGVTKNAAEKSEVYFNLGKCIGSLEQEQSKHNQLAAKEYIKSFKNLFEYIYEEKKDFHDEATEFLAYFAALSYGIDSLEDRKKWSWTQVRRQAQGLWGSMEETRDTFVEVNIPLIALSVQQINSVFNLKNKFSFDGEASFNDFSNKEKDQISQNLSKRKVEKPNKKHDEYDGEYKDGKYHGQGRLRYSNGDEYDGEWKDGKYHGQGRLETENSDIYIGEWKTGKKHGYINIRFSNGDEFVGTFKNDKKHGKSYSTKGSVLFEGEWQRGKVFNLKEINNFFHGVLSHDKSSIWFESRVRDTQLTAFVLGGIFLFAFLLLFIAVSYYDVNEKEQSEEQIKNFRALESKKNKKISDCYDQYEPAQWQHIDCSEPDN